jgi:hypothetical protein
LIVDHRKRLAQLYGARREPQPVVVPPLAYLMADGHGDPNVSRGYAEAVEALYSLSYALKFAVKRRQGIDYRVMPLEGQWWCEDMRRFSVQDKSNWSWTLMILQPPEVGAALVDECRGALRTRKPHLALHRLRHAQWEEGPCVQILHVGPFTDEGPTVQRLHDYIERQGGRLAGKHHEIYLTDIRRAAPERWRTIIRQPWVHSPEAAEPLTGASR